MTRIAKRMIPGTPVFDGDSAQQGYATNAMCYSFNDEACRKEFVANKEAYMEKFALFDAQRQAVRDRSVLGMIAEGGNVYYPAKLAGILGLNDQDLGGLQIGMSTEAFKERLLAQGLTERRVAQ
ncbi:MAG: protocatechuate 4,5-dioxygenase subunit alpha [Sphingomonadaceae bacterium]